MGAEIRKYFIRGFSHIMEIDTVLFWREGEVGAEIRKYFISSFSHIMEIDTVFFSERRGDGGGDKKIFYWGLFTYHGNR